MDIAPEGEQLIYIAIFVYRVLGIKDIMEIINKFSQPRPQNF